MQKEREWETEASVIIQHRNGYQLCLSIQRNIKDQSKLRFIQAQEKTSGENWPGNLPTLSTVGSLGVFEAACRVPNASMPEGWIVLEMPKRPAGDLMAELRVKTVVEELSK